MTHASGSGHADPLPSLWCALSPLLGGRAIAVTGTGPRWWWAGPLDVEGIALGSAQAIATALAEYSRAAGAARLYSFDSAGVAASFASFNHLRVNGQAMTGFAPLSGFHRTADGWIRTHANYPHHERALLAGLDTVSAERVPDVLKERTSAEVEESVTAAGGLAVAVRTPEAWRASPAAQAIADEPWIRFETATATPRTGTQRLQSGDPPLAGIRVLDMTRVIAGPSASRLLGALGADVLRIDPPSPSELWDHHVDTGFAKRSTIADLRNREIGRSVQELMATADVVLLGYRRGGLAAFGLDPHTIMERHPGVAVVALDAWGDLGPWEARRGFDSIVQAATGIAHLYGITTGDEWRPGALPVQALDHATGLGMAAAAVALMTSRREGQCGYGHLSLARTAMALLDAPGPAPRTEALTLPVPLRHCSSEYGDLVFVPPPLTVDGVQTEYPKAPARYGSSQLMWT